MVGAVQHVFSSPLAEDTGTVTVFNSAGLSVTFQATSLIGPNEWNNTHQETVTLSGNTLGASTVSGTNIVLAAGGIVSLSGNGQTISLTASSAAQTAPTISISLSGNTAGTSSISNTGGFVLSGGTNITLSGTGSTVIVEAPQSSISAWAVPQFPGGPPSFPGGGGQAIVALGSSVIFGCIECELPLTMSNVSIPVYFSIGSTSSTNTAHFTYAIGLYTLTGGTYSLQASSTLSIGISQSSTSVSFTVSGGANSTSFTTASAGTLTGQKWIQIPFAQSIPAALPALLAYSSSEAGALFSCSLLPYALASPIGAISPTEASAQYASVTAYDRILGGQFPATSAAFPASIATSTLGNPPAGAALIAQMGAS